ncbi:hypothetical protein A2U01_0070943, partial [Trifolium medium]|nr:hypothetical protein [Trifolium medium]
MASCFTEGQRGDDVVFQEGCRRRRRNEIRSRENKVELGCVVVLSVIRVHKAERKKEGKRK